MNDYKKGIQARRSGVQRHENPFIREPIWWEINWVYYGYRDAVENLRSRKDWWDNGWDAEDRHQKEIEKHEFRQA